MFSRWSHKLLVPLAVLLFSAPAALASTPGVDFVGQAGGSEHAVRYGVSETGPCRGWISAQPNHTLVFVHAERLRIEVSSAVDTTLVVRGAGGTWCSDDETGFNPAVERVFEAGEYEVWVGTYDRGASAEYTLSVVPAP